MKGELLQVIVDFNVAKLTKISKDAPCPPLQTFFDSLIQFLNVYQLQSTIKKFRLYLSLPHGTHSEKCVLLYPSDDKDLGLLQKQSFARFREQLYKRISEIL